MKVIICEHLGLNTETVVKYNNKEYKTCGLDIKQLVNSWRKRFMFYGTDRFEFVLAFERDEYNAIQYKPFSNVPSIMELLEKEKVHCICKDDVL